MYGVKLIKLIEICVKLTIFWISIFVPNAFTTHNYSEGKSCRNL